MVALDHVFREEWGRVLAILIVNFTDFTPSETAQCKADEMLAQLASWGRALRGVRYGLSPAVDLGLEAG